MLGMTCIVWKRISMLLLSFPLFVHCSFSPIKHFITEFSAPITARVFKFCIHLERGQVYCGKENQDAVINFCIFPFFISHANVIHVHREICVKDFSGTTMPRILKFGTNIGYDLLYYVKENQHAAASKFSVTYFLASMRARVRVYTLRVAKYTVGQKTKPRLILPSFSFCPSLTPM